MAWRVVSMAPSGRHIYRRARARLGRLINGIFQPFMTPGFDGSKLRVQNMIFDRDAIFGSAQKGKGSFVSRETLWTTMDERKACPAIPYPLSLRTERAFCGL